MNKKPIAAFLCGILVAIILLVLPSIGSTSNDVEAARVRATTPTSTLGPGCFTPTPASTSTPRPTNTPIPPTNTPVPPTNTPAPTATNTPVAGSIVYAIIGDYGADSVGEANVAKLVKSWNPSLVLTIGDNNYPDWTTGDPLVNISKYYGSYITSQTFYPTMGNHDYERDVGYGEIGNPARYLSFFSYLAPLSPSVAPDKGTFYDLKNGPVHFFMVNSNWSEWGGVDYVDNDPQPVWLKNSLAAETSLWKLVLFHHSPFTSGTVDGPSTWMQWPFASWGANIVISGHEHNYERLLEGGLTYLVDGAGGNDLYSLPVTGGVAGSQVRYSASHGALKVTASNNNILFEFYNEAGQKIDSYSMTKP